MPVRKKVVLLHPFSARKHEYIETDEKIEIACVKSSRDTVVAVLDGDGHEDESIGKKNNSYNEEFDPGSG